MTTGAGRDKTQSGKPSHRATAGENLPSEPSERIRGKVQTVRMDEALVRALKQAAIDRNTSQQDIIIRAIRRDLGLDKAQ